MRLASLAFVLILAGLSLQGELSSPLSTFRDGPYRAWGFTLFGLLTFIGLTWLWTLIRTRSVSDLIAVAPALPLLGFVALTESMDGWHVIASFVLLGWIMLFFSTKLWEEGSWLLLLHLFMPVVIALTIQFHSFGLWQKSLIAYFVLAINVHDLIRRCEHETAPRRRRHTSPRLDRQFYESGPRNPLHRQSHCEPNANREPRT